MAAPGNTQRIVDSIASAISERRLLPGTKLSEQHIGDLFAVSRTVVRQAFNQLSRDRLLVLEPARGAFVAKPTVEEARQVFEVRAMLESAIAQRLCAVITDAQIEQLRAHLQLEHAALGDAVATTRIQLLGDFHLVLARMLGNEVLVQLLSDLLIRSSLIALMYQSTHSAQTSLDEHVAIVQALENRDAASTQALMTEHLLNVLHQLNLDPHNQDLEHILKV